MANDKNAELSTSNEGECVTQRKDNVYEDSSSSDEIDIERVDEGEQFEGSVTKENNHVTDNTGKVESKVSEATTKDNNHSSFCECCFLDDTSDSDYEIDVVGDEVERFLGRNTEKEHKETVLHPSEGNDTTSSLITDKTDHRDNKGEVIYIVETDSLAKFTSVHGEKWSDSVRLEKLNNSKCQLTKERKRVSDKSNSKKIKDASTDKQTTKTARTGGGHKCTHEGCGKVFSKPCRLAQHIRTHTGEVRTALVSVSI